MYSCPTLPLGVEMSGMEYMPDLRNSGQIFGAIRHERDYY
jgi:hypothetical protein